MGVEIMESIEFTGEVLEKIFDDNFIEDNNLFDCLKGRKGTIEFKQMIGLMTIG